MEWLSWADPTLRRRVGRGDEPLVCAVRCVSRAGLRIGIAGFSRSADLRRLGRTGWTGFVQRSSWVENDVGTFIGRRQDCETGVPPWGHAARTASEHLTSFFISDTLTCGKHKGSLPMAATPCVRTTYRVYAPNEVLLAAASGEINYILWVYVSFYAGLCGLFTTL